MYCKPEGSNQQIANIIVIRDWGSEIFTGVVVGVFRGFPGQIQVPSWYLVK